MRKTRRALIALLAIIVTGTIGYLVLGFGMLDAIYQTVTTVTTVGFGEVRPFTSAGKIFTIVLVLAGVGTALYALGVLLEEIVEGNVQEHVEARRMDRAISRMHEHVIICGWGRVGAASAAHLRSTGQQLVVVDRDATKLDGMSYPFVQGDISDDDVLRSAGIAHARALVAALDTDADNVYVALSARALRPDLIIIARARSEESRAKLIRAGADRVVNPQLIGGRRMATFALQPDVAEFLEVVQHAESVDFRIDQIEIEVGSALAGQTIGDSALAETTGVVILALRRTSTAHFMPNPSADVVLEPRSILIGAGTPAGLDLLRIAAHNEPLPSGHQSVR